jgi:murein L,D-transpeptidase YcbB/YkuD
MLLLALSCTNNNSSEVNKKVADPKAMNEAVADRIKGALNKASENSGKIDEITRLEFYPVADRFYEKNNYKPVWCNDEKWLPLSDSLYRFITNAELEGLFPGDYHYAYLKVLMDTLDRDSLARMNPQFWTKADLLLTDGFLHLVKDLKQGRLEPDSVSLNKDSVLTDDFFITTLHELFEKKDLSGLLVSVQPKHKNYWDLKKGIKKFVDSMDRRVYTYLRFPFKRGDEKDSLLFINRLSKRLSESNCINHDKNLPDSAGLSNAIKKYQVQKGLKADGKYGRNLITALNNTDREKFKRIAITLDRYKQLPAEMPDKYIWVNIPGYYLRLMAADTVLFESKIICGKPETRTPLLSSEISDIITYPTWTVPTSIIVKQYLPKLKNNPNYLSRIGLKLLNNKGEDIDPVLVNWSKYSRGIPYRVVQGSGDNNALGIIKFNFANRYSVYLHDTNQRYLFKNAARALSHGCVRVQEWEKLAYFIAGNDSSQRKKNDSLQYNTDSIKTWIANKEHRFIEVKNRIKLFIRYFTCEVKNGEVKFHEDIYGEDRQLIEKYFAKK